MKILQVIPYFSPRQGGPAVVLYELTRELCRQGHDVTVLTTDYQASEHFVRDLEGAEVVRLKCALDAGGLLYSPGIGRFLAGNVRRFDVVHLHDYRTYQNCAAVKHSARAGVPYVLQAHGTLPVIVEKHRLKRMFDRVYGHRILADASKLIAVSGIEVDHYVRAGIDPAEVRVVPNGIDVSRFRELPERSRFKELTGITGKRMVLYLGRIHRRKGLDFLLGAFGLLCQEMDDAVLVIAGPDDGYRAELERLIAIRGLQDKVRIVGFVEDLNQVYCSADVLVYPGVHEIFGLVPLEAIMCGTPVIVADDSGCGELIGRHRCGYLTAYGDAECLKEKMRYALDHPEESAVLVRRGREAIESEYTWGKIAAKLVGTYEDSVCHV